MKTKVRNICLMIVSLILIFSCCLALFGCGGESDGDGENGSGENGGDDDDGTTSDGTSGSDTRVADYAITFDENYSGGSKTSVNVYGGDFDMPSSPTRDGYMFSGWYTDANATTSVDWDSIDSATTVYAGWLERKSGYSYITLDYNINNMGTYMNIEAETGMVQLNGVMNGVTCTLSGYKFKGWYTDSACTSAMSGTTLVSQDMTLYASWYVGYKFEAENTDLTEEGSNSRRAFQGYSENGNPVKTDSSCSGGAYIADMYQSGCYIYFEIVSTEAVSDATISLCAALAYGFSSNVTGTDNIQITYQDYALTLGEDTLDQRQEYSTMTFAGAASLSSNGRTNFKTYELCEISLTAGTNLIYFQVDNNTQGDGGTQKALAPLVDYMMLYVPTSTTLTMKETQNVGE